MRTWPQPPPSISGDDPQQPHSGWLISPESLLHADTRSRALQQGSQRHELLRVIPEALITAAARCRAFRPDRTASVSMCHMVFRHRRPCRSDGDTHGINAVCVMPNSHEPPLVQAGNEEAEDSRMRLVTQASCYKVPTAVPPQRNLLLSIDASAEALLVPIMGVLVPMHILTVKAIQYSQARPRLPAGLLLVPHGLTWAQGLNTATETHRS